MRISVSKIDKFYSHKCILNLDAFEIQSGTIIGLVGSNGSGKTTLLRILAGIDLKYTGDVIYDGTSIRKDRSLLKRITYLSQTPYMMQASVWENIAYPLKLRGVSEVEIKNRVDALVSELGLEAQAHQNATQLSGGEAQKTALARALVFEPSVLLLDEPTASIDSETIETIENTIIRRNTLHGMTAIMISHNRPQIERLCECVLVLQNGKMEQNKVHKLKVLKPVTTQKERGVTYV
ncbi:MAG TPA: ABC transporter [Clostridiales bacterium UBA8960]|nr:ABC transporter [Clostridiales bacterium UBA8960]